MKPVQWCVWYDLRKRMRIFGRESKRPIPRMFAGAAHRIGFRLAQQGTIAGAEYSLVGQVVITLDAKKSASRYVHIRRWP